MPRQRFCNLTIIDDMDLRDVDMNSFRNAILATLPDTAPYLPSAYELRDAIHQQHGINIPIENISYYGSGFFLRLTTPAARTQLLNNSLLNIHGNYLSFIPWKSDYGSTIVPLRDLLGSNPINVHHARDTPIDEPHERLLIEIFGIPPHLCTNSVIYRLFNGICTVNNISFLLARLECRIIARGQGSAIPVAAHLGMRNLSEMNDIVSIWPLRYETITEEMQGRSTLPEERISHIRCDSVLSTAHQREIYTYPDDEITSRPQGLPVQSPPVDDDYNPTPTRNSEEDDTSWETNTGSGNL